jgi:putative transcriptional regulator
MPINVKLDMQMLIKKMSLNELSERTGIGASNLSIFKNNRGRGIRFSTLEQVCKALKCQPGDIIEYIEEE